VDTLGSTKFNDHLGRRGQRRFPLLRQLYWVGVFFTISNVYAGSLDALSPLLRVTPRERVINECRQLISKKVRSDVNFLGSPSEAPSPADLMVYRDGVEKPIPDYFVRLCCTNHLTGGLPLTPDGFMA